MSTFELSTPTATVLSEIENKQLKQKDIAKTCVIIIISGVDADWEAINAAIVKRWSKSARERVLTMAWKMVEKRSFELDGVK